VRPEVVAYTLLAGSGLEIWHDDKPLTVAPGEPADVETCTTEPRIDGRAGDDPR